MPGTRVTEEQFEWDGNRLVHTPTGASFAWAYPDCDSADVHINWSRCGDILLNGEDYDRDDVATYARRFLAEQRGDRK